MGVLLSILAILIGLTACGGPGGETSDAQSHTGVQENAGITIGLDPAGGTSNRLPPIQAARDPARPLVVIDPGHGGNDPGAVAQSGRREKDVTLAIARAIRAELAASARVRVALTREEDRNISLIERYEIARQMGADLFVSVHADAAPHNRAARGATIYTLSEVASDREAAMLAARENGAQVGGADLNPDRHVNRILIDLAQRESMAASTDFARLLHREASPTFLFQPDHHRFASLVVLKAPDIPSILFECGYLTNPADEAFIHSPDGQKRIASGMARAVETYFARRALR